MSALSKILSSAPQAAQSRAMRMIANAAIVGLWLWLFRGTYAHLNVIFTREDFRTNQILLLGILALIVARLYQDRTHLKLELAPRLHWPALVLALGSALAYLAVKRWLDINIVATCLFGLASYGLLGMWMAPRAWHSGLPAAMLLVGVLPFGDFMQTFIGYPMRIATAEVVRRGLAVFGAAPLGVDTILVFENSVAQVDVPCSGVKSLWTGALFIIAATWIERRPINLRWLLIALAFAALLFCANLARVGILVVVGQVLGFTLAAELLHVPLGVLAFAGVCAMVVALLKVLPISHPAGATSQIVATQDLPVAPKGSSLPLPLPLSLPLLAALIALNLAYASRAVPQQPALQHAQIQMPAGLITQPIEQLRPGELDWLTKDGAEAVARVRFNWRGLTGSMLIVQSRTWRAHHRPERCFENYGLSVQGEAVHVFAPNFSARALTLSNGKAGGQLSALYWFQSADKTTDDYGVRLWQAFAVQRPTWVLVTALFDRPHAVQTDTDIQALAMALRDAMQQHLIAKN